MLVTTNQGLVCCSALADIYLRKLTKIDARNIVALHQEVHNIPGKMGSLDVTKVHWKICPAAGKGQSQGCKMFAG